ncbi:ABC transporter substrate-binding protein [Alcaligenaceae bacterium]|nr:ABC transporter substrate-binding protein [Alcaligenaceae bacterium]
MYTNQHKRTALAALLGFSCLASISYVQAAGFSQDTVKIGVLTDMSGAFADLSGLGSVEAAKMAIEDFKQANNPTFSIELISADHQNKPDIASAKAREWYDVEGVDMITDLINSSVALAVSKVGDQKKRVVMVTGSGTTRLENEDCNPYTIHYGWDTRSNSWGQVKAQAALGNNNWYFVAVDYALGNSLVAEASDALADNAGKVIGVAKHPLNAADFSSYMLQAQSANPQVIALANAGSDLVNSIKALNEFGLSQNHAIAGLVMTITDVHSVGLETAQGMTVVEDFYWDVNDQTREWGRRFFASQKRMPNFVHAATYSSVLTYLKAVQAAGTDTASDVIGQMKSGDINDVFTTNGKIREDHKMVHDVHILEVKKPSESKEPWDYYNVKQTIAGIEVAQPLSTSKCSMVKK